MSDIFRNILHNIMLLLSEIVNKEETVILLKHGIIS